MIAASLFFLSQSSRPAARAAEEEHVLTVAARSAEVVYSGTKQQVRGFETIVFEADGERYLVTGLTACAVGTDVGEYVSRVQGEAVVRDMSGQDVSAHFTVRTRDGKLKIRPRDITEAEVTLGDALTYAASWQAQAVAEVSAGGIALPESDYRVSGNVVRNAGSYTLTVTAGGNFTGQAQKTFTVAPAALTVSAEQVGTLVYNGAAQRARIEAKSSVGRTDFVWSERADGEYHAEVPAFREAGEHQVFYKANTANYAEAAGSLTVTIEPCELKIGWEDGEWLYDGEAHSPTARAENAVDGDRISLTVTGAGMDAGSYTARVTGITGEGAENYRLPAEGLTQEYRIRRRLVTFISAGGWKRYDGKPLTANSYRVLDDGFAAGEGADVLVTGARTAPGQCPNILTYRLQSGTKEKNYDIVKQEGVLTVEEN